MAKPANNENISRDQSGPEYQAAINLVRGQIRTNDSDIRSASQDQATLYKRIEKQHGVNRGAAKQFAAIDKMAPEKRTDFLRSLLGLLNFAGYDNFDDLVDRAQKPAAGGKGGAPKADPTPKKGTKAAVPDAIDARQRTNLKTGMIEQHIGGGADDDDSNWADVREASPEELGAERERIADFDAGKPGLKVVK